MKKSRSGYAAWNGCSIKPSLACASSFGAASCARADAEPACRNRAGEIARRRRGAAQTFRPTSAPFRADRPIPCQGQEISDRWQRFSRTSRTITPSSPTASSAVVDALVGSVPAHYPSAVASSNSVLKAGWFKKKKLAHWDRMRRAVCRHRPDLLARAPNCADGYRGFSPEWPALPTIFHRSMD